MSEQLELPKPEFPVGWSTATLLELIGPHGIFIDGDWVESKDQDPQGDVRLIQLADIGDGYFRDRSNRFLTREKATTLRCTLLTKMDILVARMPDPLGRSCLFPGVGQECCTVVDVCIIRPAVGDDVCPRWLMHTLNAPQSRTAIASLQKGTTRKRISRKNLAGIPFPIPPSREQARIGDATDEFLSKIDTAIANLKRVQANLKRYRASVLKAAVEGRLVPTEAELARQEGRDYEPASVLLTRILAERRRRWEEAELAKMKAKGKTPKNDKWKAKYKEPAKPDTTGLPELPEGWCWATVDQLTVVLDQGWSPKCINRSSSDSEEWTVLKTSAVQPMAFLDIHHKILPKHLAPRKHLELSVNDLLVTRAGPRSRVGICCLVRQTRARIMLCDKVYRLRTAPRLLLPSYLESALNEGRVQSRIEGQKSGISDSGLNLTQARFLKLVIAIPPITEQLRIDEAISEALLVGDRLLSASLNSKKRCKRLRQSILKWAFEGKLVDQDPNDEPASVLLDRIRAEREAAAKPAKKKPVRRRRKKAST